MLRRRRWTPPPASCCRLRCIHLLGVLLILAILSPLVSCSSSNRTDWQLLQQVVEPQVRPRVATYRNAYGARFSCTPACYLALLAHVALLAAALALLLLVPVTAAGDKAARPPFVLWFGDEDGGSCRAAPCDEHGGRGDDSAVVTGGVDGGVEIEGGIKTDEKSGSADAAESTIASERRESWTRWPSFISSWWFWCKAQYESASAAPSPPSIDAERTGLIPSVAVPAEPAKTYESIGVDTEDLLPASPPSSPGRRGSIFASAPSPPPPMKRRATRAKVPGGSELSVSFGASETSFFSELSIASRIDTASELLGVTSPPAASAVDAAASTPRSPRGSKKEVAVRDIERRASIQQRAEKRKERAKSDISYENLRDEEIQVYEYLEFVRELLEGMVIRKVCQKSAKVVKRTFFITKDMATVYWNKLGAKGWSSKKSSLDASRIDKVLRGLHGSATAEAKGKAEKTALYVSVVCSDGKRLDLEAKDEAMRQRLYIGFSRLAAEKRQEKQPPHSHHQEQQQQQQEGGEEPVASTRAVPLHRLVVPEGTTEQQQEDPELRDDPESS